MPNHSRLSHDDYTVGLICALACELTATMAVLDEHHPAIDQSPQDDNSYTLGRIGEHNVVIACLPAGQMGTNSAATVASQMRSTFGCIRFGLMVGIGGGCPSEEHDIRLGDVVVSKPGKHDGGVIQFDFGRTVEEGRFVQTGVLNSPPTILLNAVSTLQAKHNIHGHRLGIHLLSFQSARLKARYGHQGLENDLLFEADYDHVDDEPTCTRCDKGKIVGRSQRDTKEPIIHYGTIASGNQVMRHGKTRDSLARRSGVLCFEMEAAGLMNNFPCLIVRGICDYADSHKNKRWQEYAAAVAAAYAKELLLNIPSGKASKGSDATNVESTASDTEDSDQSEAETEALPVKYIPAQRNPRFSGRQDTLQAIEEYFRHCQNQQPYILRGMGGIGKTQIALEYANLSHGRGLDVFWIDCSSFRSIDADFSSIQRMLNAPKTFAEEDDRLAVLRWLEHFPNWLLIFDNADDASFPYGEWMPLPRGQQPAGRILFTTRDERLSIGVVGVQKEVPLMTDKEAITLFGAGIVPQDETELEKPDKVEALVKRIGNLPLAISLASAYLREYSWITIPQYLQHLESFKDRQKIFQYKQSFTNYNHSLMSAWEISFAKVQQVSPHAAHILMLLGFLANNTVTFAFLKQASTNQRAPYKATASPSIQSLELGDVFILPDGLDTMQAVGLLRSLSLVNFDGDAISLHPLTHEWIQARLSESEVKDWSVKSLRVLFYNCIVYAYPRDGVLPINAVCNEHIRFAYRAAFQYNTPSYLPLDCYLLFLTLLIVEDQVGVEFQTLYGLSSPDMVKLLLKSTQQPSKTAGKQLQGKTTQDLTDNSGKMAATSRIKRRLKRLPVLRKYAKDDRPKYTPQTSPTPKASNLQLPERELPVDSTFHYPINYCTELALQLLELKRWWDKLPSNLAADSELTIDQLKFIHDSSEMLDSLLKLLQDVPMIPEDHGNPSSPEVLNATLCLYISAAAMNLGRMVDIRVEKKIEPQRVCLFELAYEIGQRLDPTARQPVLLQAAISYARYIDHRAKTGQDSWLPVERQLAENLEYSIGISASAHLSQYADFFCQSMWESNHEYALKQFCSLFKEEARICFKWKRKVDTRWAEMGITEQKYRASHLESKMISEIERILA